MLSKEDKNIDKNIETGKKKRYGMQNSSINIGHSQLSVICC